ncbi:MAG TPA: hypothetical protein VM536_11095 [Chloroflexia bacterium]|nr:hypothetical protein [Chloroflexia bacterium]
MSLYFPTNQPTIAPNIMVRKQRRLPVAGDILVRLGARVEPDDVVARASMPGTPQTVEIAGPLAVKPKAATKLLSKKVGDRVSEGEVLATRRQGIGKRTTVKSPVGGTLTAYDAATGLATITPDSTTFELAAHLDGIVTEHIPYRGVVIDTPAAVVRGIAGVGGEQHGVLQVAVTDPTEELLPDQITARLAYAIVLGGGTTTAAALQRAVEHSVRAVIVGSMPEEELRAFLGYTEGLRSWALGRTGWAFPPPHVSPRPVALPPLTVILVEGFGRLPMAAKAWELLASFDGQEVAVDGTTQLRNGLTRPEIIVPLSRATGVAPYDTTAPPLGVRSLVRLIASPYLGQTARVVTLSGGRQPISSGLNTPAVEVQFADGTGVWVPVANLEVLE